ncbi:MAG TPA: FliH/SctL family protein [Burkholderiales bacterium]|nr:FliH/SctL family protein [Burkholderiales bacterium]
MSSPLAPKKQPAAWQRWEMCALADPVPAAAAAAAADDLDALRRRAESDGRRAGHDAGYEAGYRAGLEQAAAERQRLHALLMALAHGVAENEQRLADDVLNLALAFARRLLGEALAARRELVVPAVRDALLQLSESTRPARVLLNPADIELVRRFLEETGTGACALVPDAAIERGGCRVENAHCSVDATTGSRWQRLVASLGRDHGWIGSD